MCADKLKVGATARTARHDCARFLEERKNMKPAPPPTPATLAPAECAILTGAL